MINNGKLIRVDDIARHDYFIDENVKYFSFIFLTFRTLQQEI